MGARIGQRQRGAPGAAEHHPFLDTHDLPDPFNVVDQVLGRVVGQLAVRGRSATAALVEQDDPIAAGIEKPAQRR